jgi:hypothetical protein
MEKKFNTILSNQDALLAFLKSKFKLYHQSNIFFRDLHYGVWELLEQHGISLTYGKSEDLAREVIASLEEKKILRRLDGQTWLLNYPQFRLMPGKKIQIKLPTAA